MPGHLRHRQLQLGTQGLADCLGLLAQRRQGPHRAAKLQLQGTVGRMPQALRATQQGQGPARDAKTQAADLRRLHQGARQNGLGRMRIGQIQQHAHQFQQIVFDQAQRTARQQDLRRIDHILAGAAQMHKGSSVRVKQGHGFGQAAHHRNGQAAIVGAGGHQGMNIVELNPAKAGNGLRGRLRNHPHAPLGTGQRRLKVHHGLHDGRLIQHRQHFGRGQKTLKHQHRHTAPQRIFASILAMRRGLADIGKPSEGLPGARSHGR